MSTAAKGSLEGGFVAKKSFGQNFLHNEKIIDKIIQTGEISENDAILEIGPGHGALTKKLVLSPAREIILCEKDDFLFEEIKKKYDLKKTKVIHQDALTLIPSLIVRKPFKVISNLPYNISSPVIISLLSVCPTTPDKMVLMLQKEVAQRLIAPVGDSNRGWLTALVEMVCEARIAIDVSRYNFTPVPKVESSVLEMKNIVMPRDFSVKQAIRVLKAGFVSKRKKIKNSLFGFFKVPQEKVTSLSDKYKIDINLRAEDLTKENWIDLIREFKDLGLI
ncbi:MAG: Ribosomal RNA small subunit methyltransferase A [candidate division WS2 bacterium ADurb.Bin280]|uniref:Ribosomal RNA small subunit methyltransferase A n=1 Tax=candidate division WS2 bacterium ADurb.Bin280 TaxID=1852829 RepID=A0A1V5SEJ5_9BACT|nr:MAG: Ribosomal RNA small subunit methyltransferase A [candidate division WS2 bacterium ADurb.Bin280]